ncbi:MAG TPA: hypothetical protein PKC21_04895 [Oligoflexia bacterium]|nr:hypothetical protein [Oligoflexia bacterium]HMR24674.1 hypothetical protein [Oligoflexia bacterium]
MNQHFEKFMCSFIVLLYLSPQLHSQDRPYIMTQGDTLTCVAEKYIGYPVYGEQGSLNLLLSVNKSIKDKHQIKSGYVVMLPDSSKMENYSPAKQASEACQNSSSRLATNSEIRQLHEKIDRLEEKIDALTQQQQDSISSAPAQQESDNNPHESERTQTPLDDSVWFNNRTYYAGFGFLFHKLKGTDTSTSNSAKLLSDLSWQLELGWTTPMRSHPKYYSLIHTQVRYFRYSEDTNDFNVADQSIFAPDISIGVGRSFLNNRINLNLYTGIYRQIYFFTPNASSIEFDADWIGKLGLEANVALFNKASFNLGLRPSIQVIGLGDFINDQGILTNFDLYAGIKNHEFNIGYAYGQFDASGSEFKSNQIDLRYRYYF